MSGEWVSIDELKINEKNPRKIKNKRLRDLQESLLGFSKMMAISRLVTNKEMAFDSTLPLQ